MSRRAAEVALAAGVALIVFYGLLVAAQSTVLILGGAVTPIVTVLCVAAVAAGVWFALGRLPVSARVAASALVIGSLALAVLFATVTTDRSWDGNTYHKLATGALRAGWNPVWSSVGDWAERGAGNPFDVLLDVDPEGIFIDAYPKATWLFGASISQVTGSIESGKAGAILVMAALFLATVGYLGVRIPRWSAFIVAAVAALNPIAVTQVTTYYNDGAMGTVILFAILLLTALVDPGWRPPPWWRFAFPVALVSTVIVLVNVKFTGLVYAAILGLVYLAWLAVRWREQRRELWQLLSTGLAGTAIALAVAGASSYLRNLVVHGNPLYPLIGEGAVDIITRATPDSFAGRDPVSKFAISSLSASSNSAPPVAELKIPFTVGRDEISQFAFVDVRIAGWGVLFGGVLILSVVLGAYLLVRFGRANRSLLPAFLLPVAATAIGIVAVDASWWARYTPHLSVIPILVLVALFATGARGVGVVFATVLVANTAVIGAMQVREQWIQLEAGSLSRTLSAAGQQEGCLAIAAAEPTLIADPPDRDAFMFGGAVLNALDVDPSARVMSREDVLALDPDRLQTFPMSHIFTIMIATEPCE